MKYKNSDLPITEYFSKESGDHCDILNRVCILSNAFKNNTEKLLLVYLVLAFVFLKNKRNTSLQ